MIALLLAPLFALSAEAKDRPLLLWEVERDGKVSHLLGTCHMDIPLSQALPGESRSHLENARVVLAEIDAEAIDPATAAGTLFGSETSLHETLGDADFRALALRLPMMPPPLLDRMPSWAVSGLLLDVPQGVSPLDLALLQAVPNEKQRYFETWEQQIAMLAGIAEASAASLRPYESLSAADQASIAATADLCLRADPRAFEAWMNVPEAAAQMKPLLADRNHAWMPMLTPEVAQGGAFVAVGAAHLLGPDGLLTLLEAQGFETRRLKGPRDKWVLPASRGETLMRIATPVPYDPAILDAYSAFDASITGQICGTPDQGLRCSHPEPDACATAFTTAARQCRLVIAHELPADLGQQPVEQAQALGQCVVGGVLVGWAVTTPAPPEGPCAALHGQLTASMAAASAPKP